MTDLSKINYRKATEKDVSSLVQCRIDFINEVFKIDADSRADTLKNDLHEYFNNSMMDKSLIVWVAEYEDKIVGTSSLVVWHAPPTYSGIGKQGKRGYILNMYTKKPYRKEGIASILLKKLIEEAKHLNLEYVHLHTSEDGIGIYKKMGFKEPDYPELTYNI